MNDILVITVNYKDTTITENLIRSLEKLENYNVVDLVIVDSESTEQTKEQLELLVNNTPVETQLIFSKRNTYYFGGVALALNKLDLDYANGPSWIIVCNNDIVFTQQDFLKRLIALNPVANPIIAPTIQSSVTEGNLNPYMAKPIATLEKIYLSLFYINHNSARFIHLCRKYTKKIYSSIFKHDFTTSCPIYAPVGALIIFSKHYFTRGGWIDHNYKLYGEEVTVAEIAKRNGMPVIFNPELEVYHQDHGSTATHSWQRWFNDSKEAYKYYKKEYF